MSGGDDGLFCNGEEACLPDDPAADIRGCVPSVGPACIAGQTCDEDGDRCQTMCDVSGDADGDGHDSIDCGGDDCDDADELNYPGNVEVCDDHDEDCDPTTLGIDGDGDSDGHLRLECCNPQADGTDLCGDDCDDTEMDVHPGALEVCDGGKDNDCNGLADAADGVCVPCATGGTCTDADECAAGTPCGSAAGASCTNVVGTYVCTCPSGFSSPPTGGTCADIDECSAGTPCGTVAGTSCGNRVGGYICTCPRGFSAPASGGMCSDVDECAMGAPCGTVSGTTCSNTTGGYSCTCPAGYAFDDTTCVDVNECATGTPCGSDAVACANTAGSYACTCNAGYAAPAFGGSCTHINECVASPPCGRPIATDGCTDTPGSYVCSCKTNYDAPPNGGTCQLTDSWLSNLVPSAGTLSFAPEVEFYDLELPAGMSSFTLTPTVTDPGGVATSRTTVRPARELSTSSAAAAAPSPSGPTSRRPIPTPTPTPISAPPSACQPTEIPCQLDRRERTPVPRIRVLGRHRLSCPLPGRSTYSSAPGRAGRSRPS